MDADARVLGMVSRADVLGWISRGEELDRTQSVTAELEAASLVSGHVGETVGQLIDRMADTKTGRVPILDANGRLAGLVSRKDLLEARTRRTDEERDHAVHLQFRRGP